MAGILLATLASSIPMILLLGVGPIVVGTIVLVSIYSGVHLKVWKAIAAILLSIPAYCLAFMALAFTASFAQSHGLRPSSLVSDLGADMLCGLAAAIFTACIMMELLSWLLSGYWSTQHAMLLTIAGLVVLAIAYAVGEAGKRLAGHSSDTLHLWLFFGPLFVVGGPLVTMIVNDQVKRTVNVSL